MSGTNLYILDLDRTIFNTTGFFSDIKEAVTRTHHIEPTTFEATYLKFLRDTNYDAHSHYGQLTYLGGAHFDQLITESLHGRNYAFADASAWYQKTNRETDEFVIMTVGFPRFQNLKHNHAGPFRRTPIVVVPENKGALIRRWLDGKLIGEPNLDFLNQPHDHIYLIDDSADTFTALGETDKITGIRIARAEERYSDTPTPPHIRHITSFEEL